MPITGGGGSGLTQTQADARYVKKSGDTMTGELDMQQNAIIMQAPGGTATTVGSPMGLLLSLTYAAATSTANRYRVTVDSTGHLTTTLI